MLLNVEDLTEDQLKKMGLPPNPTGGNCFDTERMEYGDAIWCNMFVREHCTAEQLEAMGYYCSRPFGGWVKMGRRGEADHE